MKKGYISLTSIILIFLFVFSILTVSASSIGFVSDNAPFVKVFCGDYRHIFSTIDYGQSMTRTLSKALETAGRKACDSERATVYVSKGSYRLHSTLKVYSNTKLVATGAEFKCYRNMLCNGFDGKSDSAVKYEGSRNIEIIGGIWNMEVPFEYASTSDFNFTHSTFRFAHCRNLKVINCTFKNNYNSHDVELGGVKNAQFAGCKFINEKSLNKVEYVGGREALQIDVNTEKAVPYIPEYDITQTKNVTVSRCSFINKFRAIGSHHGVISKPYNNIKIFNNTFDNITGYAIFALYWNNVSIYNNLFRNVGSGIDIYSISNGTIKSLINPLKYEYRETLATVKNSQINIYGNKISVRAENNSIKSPFGIKVSGSKYLQDDNVTNIKKGEYYVYNVNIGMLENPNIIKAFRRRAIIISYCKNKNREHNIIEN